MTDSKLVPLEYLPGYRMADDEPDVRGWDVVAPGGARIGRVVDVLVDRAAAEIAGLLLTVPPAQPGGELGQTTLPMDRVRIDEGRRLLVVEDEGERGEPRTAAEPADRAVGRPAEQAAERPADRPLERRVAAGADAPSGAPERSAAGGQPVGGEAAGGEAARVPLFEEQLVVTRRPVVKEMLVIRKRAVQDTKVVEADVRRERLDVRRTDVTPGGPDETPAPRRE